MATFLLFLLLLPRSECLEGLVVGVNDGDTITILVDSQPVRVRLYGIDCPEKGQDFAGVAKRRVSTLCYDSIVTVQVKGKDRYGRMLGYVILADGQILNHMLVEEGLAWWFRKYSPQDGVLRLSPSFLASATRSRNILIAAVQQSQTQYADA